MVKSLSILACLLFSLSSFARSEECIVNIVIHIEDTENISQLEIEGTEFKNNRKGVAIASKLIPSEFDSEKIFYLKVLKTESENEVDTIFYGPYSSEKLEELNNFIYEYKILNPDYFCSREQ